MRSLSRAQFIKAKICAYTQVALWRPALPAAPAARRQHDVRTVGEMIDGGEVVGQRLGDAVIHYATGGRDIARRRVVLLEKAPP